MPTSSCRRPTAGTSEANRRCTESTAETSSSTGWPGRPTLNAAWGCWNGWPNWRRNPSRPLTASQRPGAGVHSGRATTASPACHVSACVPVPHSQAADDPTSPIGLHQGCSWAWTACGSWRRRTPAPRLMARGFSAHRRGLMTPARFDQHPSELGLVWRRSCLDTMGLEPTTPLAKQNGDRVCRILTSSPVLLRVS